MTEAITKAHPIDIPTLEVKYRSSKDPIESGLFELSFQISRVLRLHPDAGVINLIDHMPDSRVRSTDDMGYRQRFPLPENEGVQLTSHFQRVGGNAVLGSLVLPSVNRQDRRIYVLNQASVEGVEVKDDSLPGFALTSLQASRRFFTYGRGDIPYIAERDFEPERYLRELNAAMDFLHRDRSWCEYINFDDGVLPTLKNPAQEMAMPEVKEGMKLGYMGFEGLQAFASMHPDYDEKKMPQRFWNTLVRSCITWQNHYLYGGAPGYISLDSRGSTIELIRVPNGNNRDPQVDWQNREADPARGFWLNLDSLNTLYNNQRIDHFHGFGSQMSRFAQDLLEETQRKLAA